MYAIVMTGGKQYKVEKGMNVVIEKLDEAEVGKEVVLDQVLMIADGDKATVGKPTVEGAKVTAKVIAQKCNDNNVTVEASALSSGIYLVKVETEIGTTTSKLIVK